MKRSSGGQAIVSTTPPSPRSAAPVVAEALSGAHADDPVGHLLDRGGPAQDGGAPVPADEPGGRRPRLVPVATLFVPQHLGHAVGERGRGQHGVECHARAGQTLGQPARDGQLRGVAGAVMDQSAGMSSADCGETNAMRPSPCAGRAKVLQLAPDFRDGGLWLS